jgi:hypothetical protein
VNDNICPHCGRTVPADGGCERPYCVLNGRRLREQDNFMRCGQDAFHAYALLRVHPPLWLDLSLAQQRQWGHAAATMSRKKAEVSHAG